MKSSVGLFLKETTSNVKNLDNIKLSIQVVDDLLKAPFLFFKLWDMLRGSPYKKNILRVLIE